MDGLVFRNDYIFAWQSLQVVIYIIPTSKAISTGISGVKQSFTIANILCSKHSSTIIEDVGMGRHRWLEIVRFQATFVRDEHILHQHAVFKLLEPFRYKVIAFIINLLNAINIGRAIGTDFGHTLPNSGGVAMLHLKKCCAKKRDGHFIFVRLAIKAQVNGWGFVIRVLFKINALLGIK